MEWIRRRRRGPSTERSRTVGTGVTTTVADGSFSRLRRRVSQRPGQAAAGSSASRPCGGTTARNKSPGIEASALPETPFQPSDRPPARDGDRGAPGFPGRHLCGLVQNHPCFTISAPRGMTTARHQGRRFHPGSGRSSSAGPVFLRDQLRYLHPGRDVSPMRTGPGSSVPASGRWSPDPEASFQEGRDKARRQHAVGDAALEEGLLA